jgi:hypothetical protein
MEMSNILLENEIIPILTPKEYELNPCKIHSLKISDLRTILKYNKKKLNEFAQRHSIRSMNTMCKKMCNKMHDFTLVGNKCHLVERVELFFRQDHVAICIQKCVRGYFVRTMNKLHGPAIMQRGICMNTTDFCTLEPLDEISNIDFFSYTTNNITYGFDINSLLSFIKKRNSLKNPYMRESMNHCIPNILKLHRLISIIFPNVINHYQKTEITRLMKYTHSSQSSNITRRINTITLPDNYNSSDITQKMRQVREEPLDSRVRNLFIEMDNLGNYTDSDWFSELSRVDSIRFFRIIRDIWNYRSRMPYQVKLKICPLWDPFITSNSNYLHMNADDIAKMCINVMEDMVYMGIDNDSRILGTFQVLTALTFVSTRARIAMPWLYESLF